MTAAISPPELDLSRMVSSMMINDQVFKIINDSCNVPFVALNLQLLLFWAEERETDFLLMLIRP